MSRAPFTYGAKPATEESGKTYWRSLGELADSPEFQEAMHREFPEGASELADPVSRRSFISLMGASVGLAGLVGCRRPEEKILPYSKAPENVVPGKAEFYATAMPFAAGAIGLLVESHEGRPTKIEGNPKHPDSLGSANTFAQASVLDLYDPDRSTAPSEKGTRRSWSEAEKFLADRAAAAKSKGGKGLVILTEAHRSPTLARVLGEVQAAFPQAKVHRYDPLSRQNVREGGRLAFGQAVEPRIDLEKADVVVSLDADILASEAGSIRHARQFADRRKVTGSGDRMNRLYVAESAFTVTGGAADHRLRVKSRKVATYALALANELVQTHGLPVGPELAAALASFKADSVGQPAWVKAVAKDLAESRGRAVIVAGARQPAAVHAVVNLLNFGLGAVEQTVRFVPSFADGPDGAASVMELVAAAGKGEVETLLILGGNPVLDAPADAEFAKVLEKVPASIHLSTHVDETSAATTWHLNQAHYLEGWSDVRGEDGTASIVQPLIAPLFAGRTGAEVASSLLGRPRRAYDLVRDTWKGEAGALTFENAWRRALHDGVWAGSAYDSFVIGARGSAEVATAVRALPAAGDGVEVVFTPDPHAWDGRFANNGWLQELPDTMNKLTWDNAALISPATAKARGLSDGDVISLAANGRQLRIPVLLSPGQADDSVAVSLGQGRTRAGRVGTGVGFNTYALRTSAGFNVTFAELGKTGDRHQLARTQEHHVMEEPLTGLTREVVREGNLVQFRSNPAFAKKEPFPKLVNVFKEHEYNGHKWGMVIDLNACIGCNACTVACQAENNIPLVGKAGVLKSREMHWIRIDRYYKGGENDPSAVMQPMTCAHCENAPCETVCPVAATTHTPEGLNDMAYNRCVGTRYCANNCPFKVRRFNFFDYNRDISELEKMSKNPNVTVRMRGVMEKCTFCVQRINEAKINAKREDRTRLRDGEVVTACQQTCPTRAIDFGDLNDPNAAVTKAAANAREYKLLEDINVRPRLSYLARVRNPNPELESA